MILFDITHGQLFPSNDKPRSATDTERNAYLRWLAEHRGVDIAGCSFDDAGAYRGTGKDCVYVLPMPGYGVQPHVVCEVLDDTGEVTSRMVLPADNRCKLPMTAKQVQEWSGLKPVRKSARRSPVERVAPIATQPQAREAVSAPCAAQVDNPADISVSVAQALLVRIEALEEALAAATLERGAMVAPAIIKPLSVAPAANDDAVTRQVRSEAARRAMRRAWRMRREMRQRADLDRRALLAANETNGRLRMAVRAADESNAAEYRAWKEERAALQAKVDDFDRRLGQVVDTLTTVTAQRDNYKRIAASEQSRADQAESTTATLNVRSARLTILAQGRKAKLVVVAGELLRSRTEAARLSRELASREGDPKRGLRATGFAYVVGRNR